MHRYKSDLLARMRTEYVHEQQERYRTRLAQLEHDIEHAAPKRKKSIERPAEKASGSGT